MRSRAAVPKERVGVKRGKGSVRSSAKGTLVFLDENELIRASQSGIMFDLNNILNRVSEKIVTKLLRVFVYISEKTEMRRPQVARKLFSSERSEVRYVKTATLPGEVDRKMRDDIILWSRTGIVDRIVLGTADGGSEFQSAIKEAKANGMEVILLEAAGVFNGSLSSQVHSRIDATAKNPRDEEFRQLVGEARIYRKVDRRSPNTRFLSAVAIELRLFFRQENRTKFMKIVNWIWAKLKSEWATKGYVPDDVRIAVAALQHQGYALRWDREFDEKVGREVNFYWLNPESEALEVLASK